MPRTFDWSDKEIHVVGTSPKQLLIVAQLLASNAHVILHTDQIAATLQDLAERGHLTWLTQDYTPHDEHYVVWLTEPTPNTTGIDCTNHLDDLAARWTKTAENYTLTVKPGTVWLVGAGPGQPDLVTIGCVEAVHQADVVVTDRLVPMSVLARIRPDALLIDVAKIPHGRTTTQETINETLINHALAGARVVRLKGGDPYLFGRGMEERIACEAAGIPVHHLAGVSSAIAVPAAVGIPVTHRGISQGVSIVSGHVPPGHRSSTVNWAALAQTGNTIVVLMGVAHCAAIAQALMNAGLPPETPCAAITDQGLGDPILARWSLQGAAQHGAQGVTAPAILVIGDVTEVLGR